MELLWKKTRFRIHTFKQTFCFMGARFFKKKKSTNRNTENVVSCCLVTDCFTEQVVGLSSMVGPNMHWDDDKKMK